MVKLLNYFIFIGLILVQISCQKNERPSIFIFAVDHFSNYHVNCSNELFSSKKSGINLLCHESVRFTHAYTTSTLSVPAMGSILTGLYPIQNGLRTNSRPRLSSGFITLPEVAYQKGYHTSFYSSSAPLLRKTGLNQGFEIFEDQIPLNTNKFYHTASELFDLAKKQIDKNVSNSLFNVFYHSDLSYIDSVTKNEFGEIRALTYESQLEEFDETLYDFFQYLKQKKMWSQSHIILVGLNGRSSLSRSQESPVLNLNNENTQIALFFKPSQKIRDEEISWTLDKEVSLADLGKTIFEILGITSSQNDHLFPEPQSFFSSLQNKTQPQAKEPQPIAIESSWGTQHNLSASRMALLFNHYLFINDQKLKIYNTLSDRLELNQLSWRQVPHDIQEKFNEYMAKINSSPWSLNYSNDLEKFNQPYLDWHLPNQRRQLLRSLKLLSISHPHDHDLIGWIARIALDTQDWENLLWCGKKLDNQEWIFVANKNLNNSPKSKNELKTDHKCLKWIYQKNVPSDYFKICNDSLFIALLQWQHADNFKINREVAQKKFEKKYFNELIEKKVLEMNKSLGMVWDFHPLKEDAPSLSDLALALPELNRLKVNFNKLNLNKQIEDDEY